jgi:hypothetical protein
MAIAIGLVLANVGTQKELYRTDVKAAEAAHQAANLADLKANHSARNAAIAEAEAVAVLTGRTVYDSATNKLYTVKDGKVVAETPDFPELEVVVPPVDIDGDGNPDNVDGEEAPANPE